VISPKQNARRCFPIEPNEVIAMNNFPILSQEDTGRPYEYVEGQGINGRAGVIVVQRRVQVRADMDAAGELSDIAGRPITNSSYEPEIERRVTRPWRDGV
jgi:hypothetical protein